MKEIGQDFQQKSEAINYTVFESMQTVMDYVEETLENLMLPPTEGIKFLANAFILSPRWWFDIFARSKIAYVNT